MLKRRIERWAALLQKMNGRDGHTPFLELGAQPYMCGKKFLDTLIKMTSPHGQELPLGLIGGQGAPPPQHTPPTLTWDMETFEVRLACFSKEQITQQFFEGGRIKTQVYRFLR